MFESRFGDSIIERACEKGLQPERALDIFEAMFGNFRSHAEAACYKLGNFRSNADAATAKTNSAY